MDEDIVIILSSERLKQLCDDDLSSERLLKFLRKQDKLTIKTVKSILKDLRENSAGCILKCSKNDCDNFVIKDPSLITKSNEPEIVKLLGGLAGFNGNPPEEFEQFINRLFARQNQLYSDAKKVTEVHIVDAYLAKRVLFKETKRNEKEIRFYPHLDEVYRKYLEKFASTYKNAKINLYTDLTISLCPSFSNDNQLTVKELAEKTISELNTTPEFSLFEFSNCHDRFIILKTEITVMGLFIGASINGFVGNKLFAVSELEPQDCCAIYEILLKSQRVASTASRNTALKA